VFDDTAYKDDDPEMTTKIIALMSKVDCFAPLLNVRQRADLLLTDAGTRSATSGDHG
jgi:hypothetical protein